jgi:cadmium resistance protein CadD (predicted permease)
MSSFAGVVGLGLAAFVITNLDDMLVVSAFFADPRMHPRSVVVGQFLGISILVMVSSVIALLALAIPVGWTSLLGLVPLGLGLRSF